MLGILVLAGVLVVLMVLAFRVVRQKNIDIVVVSSIDGRNRCCSATLRNEKNQ